MQRILVSLMLSTAALAGMASEAQSLQVVPLTVPNDTLQIRLVDTDLRAAIQALARYLAKPVLTAGVPSVRVTLETPGYVDRSAVLGLLEGLVEMHGLILVDEGGFYRISSESEATLEVTAASALAPDGDAGSIALRVVRLKHARAADVAATLGQLFGGTAAIQPAGGLSSGTLSDELRRTSTPALAGGTVSSSASASLQIVADPQTNTLLLRATDAQFALLQEAIGALDVRPLQVLVEVLIIEARRDRSFSLGTDLVLAPQDVEGATVDGSLSGAGLGDVILRIMGIAKGRLDALIAAAEARGDVRIVSRPVLLASNNSEARFLVGSQRPFVQVSRSLPTDTPSRDQVIQYRDVGTKLTVKPTINSDGYVSLVIQQEINAATNETQFDAPVISTREAFTQVLVKDGQTIVLGGLMDHQRDRTRHGIPVLSSIPLLGGLFGGQSSRESETELFLFVTPRIIDSDEKAAELTSERYPDELEQ